MISLLGIQTPARATHIVGGEMYYEYLGNNYYRIMLIIYRDCFYGVPPFDPVASIGIFTGTNQLYTELCVPVSPDSSLLPSTINSPCFVPPVNICYRKGYYTTTVYLPPNQTGYQLAYQRCCRNHTIINIQNPDDVGITVYASIPPVSQLGYNSNPVFNALPPPFLCLGVPFTFDHSATDADGDSLVYSLCTPLVGGEPFSCGVAPCGVPLTCGPAPHPPFNPPYSTVTWKPPFNLNNLMGGVPLTIHPQTGQLTATPNTIGQFVIGVCVAEYRNGVLLSRTRRDLQFNVVACPTLVIAALQNPIIVCGSNTVQFQNQSIGAGSYFWNFGDPTTLADTSNAVNPSWTYPGPGNYTVTLIAYSQFGQSCSDTTTAVVKIFPPFQADFDWTQLPCSLAVSFTSSSQNNGSGFASQWLWNFGDNSTSTQPNPVHVYTSAGSYTVTLTVTSDSGCVKVITKNIVVNPLLSAQVNVLSPVVCHNDCNASVTASAVNGLPPLTYQWNTGQTSSTLSGLCSGTYTVTITDSLNCTATASVFVANPPPLSLTVSTTDDYCGQLCIGTAQVSAVGGNGPYTYLWNPAGQTTAYVNNLCQGTYDILITDANGCTVAGTATVGYVDYFPPFSAVPPETTIYQGQSVNIYSTVYPGATYQWSPPDGLNSTTIPNPVATPQQSITYIVQFADSNGCPNSDTVRIIVRETICIEPEIFVPNAFSPNGDGNNDILYVRGNTIRELLFRIYNRWGEKVFETTDPSAGWNGTYKGARVQPGVYDYYLEATCVDNERFFKKGNITVLR
jgi:gliding motility-associated-like protein